MSVMKGTPILRCKRCGRIYTFTLSTTDSDTEGRLLHELMAGILKDGYCDMCRAQHTWYIQQGRDEDWKAGRP